MNNYRMKKLQNLEEEEQQVKNGVRQQLRKPANTKKTRFLSYIAATGVSIIAVLLLFLFIHPFENERSSTGEEDFSLSEFGFNPFESRKAYFIVAMLFWNGEEEAIIHSVELVDGARNPLQYEKDHIALQVYGADSSKKTGLYTGKDIGEYRELSEMTIQPNVDNRIIFEFVLGDDFEPIKNMGLKITYETAGEMDVQYYSWYTLNHLEIEAVDFDQLIKDLNLSSEELAAYSAFRQSKNNSDLATLGPVSIARLYLLAWMEGDKELQYDFYTDQEGYVAWSLEEHLAFSPFGQASIAEVQKLFYELSQGEFIQTSETEGYISFTQESSEVPAGFQLKQNDDGIWQVSFMPMQ